MNMELPPNLWYGIALAPHVAQVYPEPILEQLRTLDVAQLARKIGHELRDQGATVRRGNTGRFDEELAQHLADYSKTLSYPAGLTPANLRAGAEEPPVVEDLLLAALVQQGNYNLGVRKMSYSEYSRTIMAQNSMDLMEGMVEATPLQATYAVDQLLGIAKTTPVPWTWVMAPKVGSAMDRVLSVDFTLGEGLYTGLTMEPFRYKTDKMLDLERRNRKMILFGETNPVNPRLMYYDARKDQAMKCYLPPPSLTLLLAQVVVDADMLSSAPTMRDLGLTPDPALAMALNTRAELAQQAVESVRLKDLANPPPEGYEGYTLIQYLIECMQEDEED